jgi:8-oxo-dGTP diphosphatase
MIQHVMVGVILNPQNQILVALRPPDKTLAGLWEFPGGKLEQGETPFDGLARELAEEIGIQVESATPWLDVVSEGSTRMTRLDVWKVNTYQGEPFGREGQLIRWIDVAALDTLVFPEANKPICERLVIELSV